ncbi:hypothetical protein F5Y10DRAFT_138698 [Nemania abortiva]|nr:hypothetical protein F5Y10DRAFT_138698 [Nemania abortiva]
MPSSSTSSSPTNTTTSGTGSQTQSTATSTSPTSTLSSSSTSTSTSTSTLTPTSSSSTTTSTSTSSSSSTTTSPPSTSPTCTPGSADTGLLPNGDFEAGLSPWSLDLVDLFDTSYTLDSSTPGANGSCTSFAVAMRTNPQTQSLRENLRLRSDLLAFSAPGTALHLSFYVRFARRNAAHLVLYANGQRLRVLRALDFTPVGDTVGTAAAAGGWTLVTMDYTTNDRLLQLSFSYELRAARNNTIWLDQVSIFPPGVSQSPPPTSLFLQPPATTLATAVRTLP